VIGVPAILSMIVIPVAGSAAPSDTCVRRPASPADPSRQPILPPEPTLSMEPRFTIPPPLSSPEQLAALNKLPSSHSSVASRASRRKNGVRAADTIVHGDAIRCAVPRIRKRIAAAAPVMAPATHGL
jgi:hypothetical protein